MHLHWWTNNKKYITVRSITTISKGFKTISQDCFEKFQFCCRTLCDVWSLSFLPLLSFQICIIGKEFYQVQKPLVVCTKAKNVWVSYRDWENDPLKRISMLLSLKNSIHVFYHLLIVSKIHAIIHNVTSRSNPRKKRLLGLS